VNSKLMRLLAGSALIAALAIPGMAQSQVQTTPGEKTPRITARQREQQRRIRQGTRSGQLTRAEAARLEARERKLQADKLKAKSDGKVTVAERRKLKREENRDSRAIYRQKHDAQTRKGLAKN
jgi:hypothetical protein